MTLGLNTINGLVSGAAAVSVHAWVKLASTTTAAFDNRVLSQFIASGGNGLLLSIDKTGANRVVRAAARSVSTDSLTSKLSTTDLALSTWHSVGAVFNFTGDTTTPYANGVAEGGGAATYANNTYTVGVASSQDVIGSNTVTGINTISQIDGEIAHLAIWAGDIGANGFTALWRGQQAGRVRDSNGNRPVFWMPIWGNASPEYCLVCGATGTITGSLPFASDAPVRPFTQMERASIGEIVTFNPAWAHRSNRLLSGGVLGG